MNIPIEQAQIIEIPAYIPRSGEAIECIVKPNTDKETSIHLNGLYHVKAVSYSPIYKKWYIMPEGEETWFRLEIFKVVR